MIFDWFKPRKLQEPKPMWEYSEKPVYDYEAGHRETMAIIEDILTHLDELKTLVGELKEKEND